MNRKGLLRKINNIILKNDEILAINLLCELLENNDEKIEDLMYILIDNFQLYGYIKENNINDFKNTFIYDSFEYTLLSYSGEYIKRLNNGQISLLDTIKEKDKLIISAPTSFGKTSLLIEYIIKNNTNLQNITFIVPTNSLIEELYIKLLKINKTNSLDYNIAINIYQKNSKNIRILTPEKFLNYYQYHNLDNEDLIIMDETYKIDSNENDISDVIDNRALKFRKVIELLGKSKTKVVMLSPYTYEKDESMKLFMNKYNIIEENRRIKYVVHNYYNLSKLKMFKNHFSDNTITFKDYDNTIKKTVQILKKIKNDSNVIYINYPSMAIKILDKLNQTDFKVNTISNDERYNIFIKHIENNYTVNDIDEWYILSALKKGIGIYVSSMPRYIKREIVDLFERDIIKTLIVTTSFIEGVNSCAKNIIITSGFTGGNEPLNEMELLNISGRAGRFGKRYIGNVYFVDTKIYEKTCNVKDIGVKLSNPNYQKNNNIDITRNDYEIEMIDDKFLNKKEKNRKNEIIKETEQNNLDFNELSNLCISVPNEWKIKLYNYFKLKNKPQIYKEYIDSVIMNEKEKIIDGIEKIFYSLKDANIPFENKNFSNVSPFKKNGDFLWGVLYKTHINGNIKQTLKLKKSYILFEKKSMDSSYFKKSWMNKYFKDNIFQDNKLYDETFKFISNIIEYKIPYYICFFAEIFNYYLQKENIILENNSQTNFEEILEKIDIIGIEEKLIPYYDYGFPKEMLDKLGKLDNSLEDYEIDLLEQFDEYEKIMLKEFVDIIK